MSFLREGLSINKYHYYYLHSTWWYSVLKEDFFSLFLIMEILESASVSRYYNRRLQLLAGPREATGMRDFYQHSTCGPAVYSVRGC